MRIKIFRVANFFIKNQCYLLYKDHIGVLIDPAWDYDLIHDFLIRHHITVKAILLTHAHIDHTHLAYRFSENRNIPVFMSDVEIDYSDFTVPKLKKLSHLNKITVDCFNIIPIITPGHTLGSTCYLIENHLFSGDTVFIEGVGICNYNNASQLYNSVQLLKKHLLKSTLFWPGHSFGKSPGKDLEYLMKNNIYFQFENRKHFVDFRMRKNKPNPFLFK